MRQMIKGLVAAFAVMTAGAARPRWRAATAVAVARSPVPAPRLCAGLRTDLQLRLRERLRHLRQPLGL